MVGEGYDRRHRRQGGHRPAGRRRRGHRHRHRGPHRRPGHRLPARVGPAVRRRLDHARLRQHRGPGAPLGGHADDLRVAPLEINPQIIYGTPRPTRTIETLADLGEEGVTINIFEGGTFAEVFVGRGHLAARARSTRPTTAARAGSSPRTAPSPSRASPRPSRTRTRTCSRTGASRSRYQTLHDAGFEVYSQTLSVRPDQLESWRPCLEQFVPIVQQAQVDFLNDPARANAIIIDAVAQYADFWEYDEGLAEYSVETQQRARPGRQRPRRHARQHGRGPRSRA